MYADPHQLLSLADDLRARGRSMRRLAHDVRRDVAVVEWQGSSADAMRNSTRRLCGSLLRLADEHDRAAELLTEHAHRVAHRLGIAVGVVHWLERVA